jgi:DNA-binding response OmpR family regulator
VQSNGGNDVGESVTVVVVDDERPLVELVSRYLRREGYEVHAAYDGHQALEVIARVTPDVIVLDLMLPGVDGLEIARRVRADSDAYLVMLTARTEEVDRIVGLRLGADDYVTKPFSPRELVARIQAMLRRPRRPAPSSAGDDGVRRLDGLIIDPVAREVHLDDQPVVLTRLEFDLLDLLSSRPRRVFTKQQLLEGVWGSAEYRDDHVVAVHVANLRRKLRDDADAPRWIHTVRGVGFRLGGP